MSKMSELAIDIETMLTNGVSPDAIAYSMGIPLKWVLAVNEMLIEQAEHMPRRAVGSDRIW